MPRLIEPRWSSKVCYGFGEDELLYRFESHFEPSFREEHNPEYASFFGGDDGYDAYAALLDERAVSPNDVCDVGHDIAYYGECALETESDWLRGAFDPLVAPLLTLGDPPGTTSPPFKILDLHVDHLGSVRLVTDEFQDIVSQHDFFPFGEEIMPMFDYSTKMFTGHERDRETGVDYMMARYYDPSLVRFLSVDPSRKGIGLGSPLTWNRFSYVMNNPLNRIDPNGKVSYLVSRPTALGKNHMFIVTHAQYPGDPKGRVKSYGKSSTKGSKGNVGRVNEKTTGFSKGTSDTDQKSWRSLDPNGASADVQFVEIPATDGKVASVAGALRENTDYDLAGPNSNSAAQAIADKAAGKPVEPPENADSGGVLGEAPGIEDTDDLEFDEKQIESDEAAGKHKEHVLHKDPKRKET